MSVLGYSDDEERGTDEPGVTRLTRVLATERQTHGYAPVDGECTQDPDGRVTRYIGKQLFYLIAQHNKKICKCEL